MSEKQYLTYSEIEETVEEALTDILIARDYLDQESHYKDDFDADHSYAAWQRLEITRNRLKTLREKIKRFEIIPEEPKIEASGDDE